MGRKSVSFEFSSQNFVYSKQSRLSPRQFQEIESQLDAVKFSTRDYIFVIAEPENFHGGERRDTQRKATTYRVQFLQLILTERYRSREYTATREKERERKKKEKGGERKGEKATRQPRAVLHIIIPRSRYSILAVAASNEEIYALIAGTSRVNTRTQRSLLWLDRDASSERRLGNSLQAPVCWSARARCCCIIVSLILASTKTTAIKSILSRAQRE